MTYEKKRKSLPPWVYNTYQNRFAPHDPASEEAREIELHKAYLGILTSKSPMWEYEHEVRMIYDQAKLNPASDFTEVSDACADCRDKGAPKENCTMPWFRNAVKLPPEAILGVIFGADCPINYINEILPILAEERYHHVKLYWSSLHSAEYNIHYFQTDTETIRTYQQSHSEMIASAKNHIIYRNGNKNWSAYAAQKGVNYRPPQ